MLARFWHWPYANGPESGPPVLLLSRGFPMPYWSVMFLLLALTTGIVGFSGEAGSASGLAKLASAVFLVLLTLSLARQLLKNFELASTSKRRKP